VSLVLDAGAFVAFERGDKLTGALISAEFVARRTPLSHGGIVGQVWRGDGGRQARLARLLRSLDIVALDEALGRRAGLLLSKARATDVVDAAVILLASDGDMILTSDPDDLERLADAAGLHVEIVPV